LWMIQAGIKLRLCNVAVFMMADLIRLCCIFFSVTKDIGKVCAMKRLYGLWQSL